MRFRVLFVLLAAGWPALAAAHQSSVVYSDLAPRPGRLSYRASIASADLFEALGSSGPEQVTRQAALDGRERIGAYVLGRISAFAAAERCDGTVEDVSVRDKADGFFVDVRLEFACPQLTPLAVQYDLFFDLDPRHQGFAKASLTGGTTLQHVFRAGDRRWALSYQPGLGETALEYLRLGVEHIFTGTDHVAFLLGLLLVAPFFAAGAARPTRAATWYTVKIASAFTLAHSITLVVAALGLLRIPASIVEPLIAATIAFVGVENLVAARRPGAEVPAHRGALTFAFGLVHGLGFAGLLAEIGLPQRGLALALVSFNVGVELGQVCIVAVAVPLLVLAARAAGARFRIGFQVASAALVVAGLAWLVERVS